MSEPTPEAIEAAIRAIVASLPNDADLETHRPWATGYARAALSAAAPYLIREAQAQALEQVAEDWEALVRREKPPIRGYNFLRARAAAIRDGAA
jgi:hypothetical protein